MTSLKLHPTDALIIVDVQMDFLPGGTLAVKSGEQVIAPLNRYIELFQSKNLRIYATRDWHPANHSSFQDQSGPWPIHCVADTAGAQFSPRLRLPATAIIISKGVAVGTDGYSGFADTTLDEDLRRHDIQRVFIGGLATDYCVLNTVKDALRLKYQVGLLTDAIQAVNVHPEDGARAQQDMVTLGAKPQTFEQFT